MHVLRYRCCSVLNVRVDMYKYFLPRTIIQWNTPQILDIDKIDPETFRDTVTNIICDL